MEIEKKKVPHFKEKFNEQFTEICYSRTVLQ